MQKGNACERRRERKAGDEEKEEEDDDEETEHFFFVYVVAGNRTILARTLFALYCCRCKTKHTLLHHMLAWRKAETRP